MKIIRKGEAKGEKGVRKEKEKNYKGRKMKIRRKEKVENVGKGNEGRIEGENK